MTRNEFSHHLHMKLLAKSFHRKGDELTSVLLGDAVSTASDMFEAELKVKEKEIIELKSNLEVYRRLRNKDIERAFDE